MFLPYMSTDSQLQNEIKYQIETEQGFLQEDKIVDVAAKTKRTKQMEAVTKNLKNRRHSKIMLFFHGNAEDIGIARRTLNGLRASLKVSGAYFCDLFFLKILDFDTGCRILGLRTVRG